MLRTYPVERPSNAPATGRLLYTFLMQHLAIPAAANHQIWYAGVEAQLQELEKFPFRGDIPKGETCALHSLAGKPIHSPYTFTGEESQVLVSDLSDEARKKLKIPANAREKDKVYNGNFKPYEHLPPLTKMSNELAALSVPKSISSYLAGVQGKVNYSEKDVMNLLEKIFSDLSGQEMMHFLYGNNSAWSALAYMREQGNINGDLMTEFHGQNPYDFYMKDLGTILPTLFYALANLGSNPVRFQEKLDIEIWGARDVAEYMRRFMPKMT